MPKPSWREEIKACFDDLRILEKCRFEVGQQFGRFSADVALPAFEGLTKEFAGFKVRCRYRRTKDNRLHFQAAFPRGREPQFEYILWVPGKAVELTFMLTIKGRPSPAAEILEKTFPFLRKARPEEILKLDKDDLAHDVVARYKRFVTDAAITPD